MPPTPFTRTAFFIAQCKKLRKKPVANVYIDASGKLTPLGERRYGRPKGFRRGVREKVWTNAKKGNGSVLDPYSKKKLNSKRWDMGHRQKFEFKKHRISAAIRKITREEFLDEHNEPAHFQPEDPASNSGHSHEDKTTAYSGA